MKRLVILCLLAAAVGGPAQARITTPGAGGIIAGLVPINEDLGGPEACVGANTRIEVRDAVGTVVASRTKGTGGPLSYVWDSRGSRAGAYSLVSQGTFEVFGTPAVCKPTDWYTISVVKVFLDNPSSIGFKPPDSGIFADSIEVTAELMGPSGMRLAGRTMWFSLDGGDAAVPGLTDEFGRAHAVINIGAAPGPTKLRARFDGDDAFGPSAVVTPFTVLQRDAALFYTGPFRVARGEQVRLSARLVDPRTHAGRSDRPVTFALTCPGACAGPWTVPTDGTGVATVALNVDMLPAGGYALTLSSPAETGYPAAFAKAALEVGLRPTSIISTGATRGFRGQRVTLEAQLVEVATARGLADRVVTFSLGPIQQDAITDASGVAHLEVQLDLDPATYALGISFDGDADHEPSVDQRAFDVGWEYTFKDMFGGGTVYLNPSTSEARAVTPASQGDIQKLILTVGLDRVLIATGGPVGLVAGTFDLGSQTFVAVVTVGGTPAVFASVA
jgi:hypothetical protein